MNAPDRSILIVDDDPDVRQTLADVLEVMGYGVVSVANGVEALSAIERCDFELALLDYKMPGMSGVELYREMKKRRPSLVTIMITAWAGTDGAAKAVEAGTWEVLRKPVDMKVLLEKIESVFASPRILLVDDDRELCDGLWQILNQHRLRVDVAYDSAGAKCAIDRGRVDVGIVDVRLGTEDGRELAKNFRETQVAKHIVLMSGHDAELQSGGEEPFTDVVRKPIDVQRFLDRVTQHAQREDEA